MMKLKFSENLYKASKKVIGLFALSAFILLSFFSPAFGAISIPRVTFTVNDANCPNTNADNCSGISSVTVPASYITLRWRSFNADSCTASASGNTSSWSGSKSTDGAEQIFSGLPGSIRYSITCSGINGGSVSNSVIVNILPTPTSGNTTNNPGTLNNPPITQTTQGGLSSSPSPAPTYANCSLAGMKTFKDIIMRFVIGCILTRSVYLIIAIAIAVFLWGIFKFISSEGDDKQGGRELMFWGIVGLFVMVSVWGLVAILQSTFGFGLDRGQIYDNVNPVSPNITGGV